jgi:hypothetical protein
LKDTGDLEVDESNTGKGVKGSDSSVDFKNRFIKGEVLTVEIPKKSKDLDKSLLCI